MSDADRVSLQPAWLLHYRSHRDTSFIVDVFTLDHGVVPMLARGGRSSRPATRALYQPFRPLLVSWVGQRDLRTLTGIEDSGAALEFSPSRMACGYYLNELVLRLLGKGQAQPELFAHYMVTLNELATDALAEPLLRRFEVQLLEALGLLPDLSRCTTDGHPVLDEQRYRVAPQLAMAIPAEAGDTAIAELMADHQITEASGALTQTIEVSGSTLNALAQLDTARLSESDCRQEAKRLMRAWLQVHLGSKPIQSRSVFQSLTPPPPPAHHG